MSSVASCIVDVPPAVNGENGLYLGCPHPCRPDNKTVYITDDGTNVGFFKFVADKAGNLSSGERCGEC